MNTLDKKTITVEHKGKEVEITVIRATTRTGIKRSLMIFNAMDQHDKAVAEGKEIDEIAYVVAYRTLPDIVAGTESVKGMPFPPTIDQLLELPEQLVDIWISTIYEVNPQWDPARLMKKPDDEEEAKKAVT